MDEQDIPDNVVVMPGVDPTKPLMKENDYIHEIELAADIKELLNKYDGVVTNVALVGTLTSFATLVALESIQRGE